MSFVSSAIWDTTTLLLSCTSSLHHCELQVSLRHVLSDTYLRLPVWHSAQKDRRNYTAPMIQGIQSRIPLRRTHIERYLQQELFIRSIFVWRARDPLQWVRVPVTRTMSHSNRIVSQINCHYALSFDHSWNLRTSGFHFKWSLITLVDPQ